MKKDYVSCLFKYIRINKASSKTQSEICLIEICLVFYCRVWFLLFLLVATFLIINFSIFCFLCIGIYKPHMFRQTFLPVSF